MTTAKDLLPWEASLIPVSSFPLQGADRTHKAVFLRHLTDVLLDRGARQQVYLQAWKLTPQTGGDVLAANAKQWIPKLGLGVWPNRQVEGWTETSFANAAAAMITGAEPRMPSHRLLRLNGTAKQLAAASVAMQGTGTLLTTFANLKAEQIEGRAREYYLPTLESPVAAKADFLFPLLDGATVKSARSSLNLTRWLCGIDVYLRESAEDKAMLLLSRFPLAPLLKDIQQRASLDSGRKAASPASQAARTTERRRLSPLDPALR